MEQGIDYFPTGSRWVLFSVCVFLCTFNITVAPFRCKYKAVDKTTFWNKCSYIKQYWDDVMLVFFFFHHTVSFKLILNDLTDKHLFTPAFTACPHVSFQKKAKYWKNYWGRILYYAAHTCACCHHLYFIRHIHQLLLRCALHSPSCLLMPSIPPNFSATSSSLSQTNPQLYLTPQSGKLALRMEYKWHHYVIFNLLLQQYPIPQIAPFTTRPICSGLAGPVLFMENIKELLN